MICAGAVCGHITANGVGSLGAASGISDAKIMGFLRVIHSFLPMTA